MVVFFFIVMNHRGLIGEKTPILNKRKVSKLVVVNYLRGLTSTHNARGIGSPTYYPYTSFHTS